MLMHIYTYCYQYIFAVQLSSQAAYLYGKATMILKLDWIWNIGAPISFVKQKQYLKWNGVSDHEIYFWAVQKEFGKVSQLMAVRLPTVLL